MQGSFAYQILRITLCVLIASAIVSWLAILLLRRSREPVVLILKWVFTILIGGAAMCFFFVSGEANFSDVCVMCFAGMILVLIWGRHLGEFIAKPFTSIYDGGNDEIDPQPYYSIAIAQRKQGHYREAVTKIREQLQKFPKDLQGQMMLAEIHAENLNDLPGAEVIINRICEQPGHTPMQLAHALNTLADWHLKIALDRDAARATWQKLIDLFPGSEQAMSATQRIAHLATNDAMLGGREPERVRMREGIKNLGLLDSKVDLAPAQADPAQLAAEYVKQLEQHPLDMETREKLAVLYAEHFGRLDLATDQLEQLIRLRQQSPKQVSHWVNLLADLQIKGGASFEMVRNTLQLLVDLYPQLAVADQARSRLSRLQLEFKAMETNQSVKMGTYEQNIGLKYGNPARR